MSNSIADTLDHSFTCKTCRTQEDSHIFLVNHFWALQAKFLYVHVLQKLWHISANWTQWNECTERVSRDGISSSQRTSWWEPYLRALFSCLHKFKSEVWNLWLALIHYSCVNKCGHQDMQGRRLQVRTWKSYTWQQNFAWKLVWYYNSPNESLEKELVF